MSVRSARVKRPREFRESELRQIAEIQYLIKSDGLNASVDKIKKWVMAQPDFAWPQYLLEVIRDLHKGIIYKQFKKAKINPEGRYTKREVADLLNLSYSRVNQLIAEGKLEPMPEEFSRKNCRVFSGAKLEKYRASSGDR